MGLKRNFSRQIAASKTEVPSMSEGRKDASPVMREITVSNLRKQLADVLNHVRYADEMVIIFNHGKPFAAIVPLSGIESVISSQRDVHEPVK
jgi:prevent-host-death family protein